MTHYVGSVLYYVMVKIQTLIDPELTPIDGINIGLL